MAVRKLTTGKWLCECYPAGRSGRRVRKQFATKGEALAFERHTMEETEAKPWLGESVDRRTLKDVVELWFKLHGKSLTAGRHVYDKLLLMVDALWAHAPARRQWRSSVIQLAVTSRRWAMRAPMQSPTSC